MRIYMQYQCIPTHTCHTCTYQRYMLMHALHAYICTYMQYTLIAAYMHIHGHTCDKQTPQTWNGHISATNYPFETSQRTEVTNELCWFVVYFTFSLRSDCRSKIDRGGHLWSTRALKLRSDFSTRGCILCSARGRAIGPSLILSGWSWQILWLWQNRPKHEIVQVGRLGCAIKPKINIRFQHTRGCLVQFPWEGDWATFKSVWSILVDSTAVAR
jgi:hypothetical protein